MTSLNLNAPLKIAMGIVGGIVGFILTLTLMSETANDVGGAAGNISAKSDIYGFTTLFKKKGILLLLIPVIVFAAIVSMVVKMVKG